jgi:CRISPR-associated protein Cas6
MAVIDLLFPIVGESLPTDHAYGLYSALSRIVTSLHSSAGRIQVGPIRGRYSGQGLLQLEPRRSCLRLRLPLEEIPAVLPLAGKPLQVLGHTIHLGVPQVSALVPAPVLIARLVTIKGFTEPTPFLGAVRRQLDALGVAGVPSVPLIPHGIHQGQPRRHVVRVKEKRVVGFTLQVTHLTGEHSVTLQQEGLGGRRRMGAGFFVPMRNAEVES